MYLKVKWYGKVKGNSISLDDKDSYKRWIQYRFKDGERVEITISRESQDQTHEQYKYLYSCIYEPFSTEFGWNIADVDEWMKKSFMDEYGIIFPKGMTLSKAANFNREWLAKYIDFCIRQCAEKGISVVPPKGDK